MALRWGVFSDSYVSENRLQLRGILLMRLSAPSDRMVAFIWYPACLSEAPPASVQPASLPEVFAASLCPPPRLLKALGGPKSSEPRTRKSKPATACLFSLPHRKHPTPIRPPPPPPKTTAIKQAPSLLLHLLYHTHKHTHTPRPHSYLPTPHALPHHKHTWPTSLPARHESDGCSAFTPVIHSY